MNVFQIEYQYTPDELNPKKEEKKEGEGADTKTADKTEESKIWYVFNFNLNNYIVKKTNYLKLFYNNHSYHL